MKMVLANKRLLATVCSFAVLLSALAVSALPMYAQTDTSVNLLAEHMTSIKSVQQDKVSGEVSDSTKFDNVLDILTDGDTSVKKDVGTGELTDVSQGVQITLDKAYTLSKISLLIGISSHPDYLKVYASEKLADLYTADSLLGEDLEAKGSVDIDTTVKAKYIAVLVTGTTAYNIARPYEYQVMGIESTGTDVDEDLGGDTGDTYNGINLIDKITEVVGLLQDRGNGSVAPDERFSKGARDIIHDGITDVHTDVYGAHDWESPKNVGVRLKLDVPINVEKLVLYSGLSGYPDTLKVYASDQLGNLYADTSLIQKDVVCVGEAQEVAIGKTIQYVAIFITSDGTWRPKEFELYAPEGTEIPDGIAVENLIDRITEVTGLLQERSNGSVSGGDRFSQDACDIIHDGVTDVHTDVYGAHDWEYPKNVGVRLKLDAPIHVEKLVLYSGLSSHPDTLKVYASDQLDNLYADASLIQADVVCIGEAQEVAIGKTIQYVAIFITSDGTWRPKEFELYAPVGTNVPEEVVTENLLAEHMLSIKSVQQDKATGTVSDSTKFDNVLDLLTDGDTSVKKDVGTGELTDVSQGVQITLDKAYTLSKIVLLTGISSHPDYLKVYASEKLADLYTPDSLLGEDLEAKGSVEVDTEVKVRHIAILVTGTTAYDIARPYEYQVMGVVSTGTEVDEDLGGGAGGTYNGINLIDLITEVTGLLQDRGNGSVAVDARFSQEACDAIHDGVTDKHKDVYGAHDWEYPKNVGVRLTLYAPINVEKLVLYSGLSGYPDTLKIYASDQLSNLYADSSLIQKDVVCVGEAQEVAIGKTIQYVALFITSDGTWRPKEFELYAPEGTELPEVIVAENLLPDHLESAKSILQNISNGTVSEDAGNRFDMNGALAAITDGDISKHVDVYGAKDWETPQYVGALLTLDDVYDVGNIKLYSGMSQYVDYLRVYASDNLNNLYTNANLLANGIACNGDAVTVVAAKKVKYVAVLITDYNGCGRVTEFEVYTATGNESGGQTPVPPVEGGDDTPGGSDPQDPPVGEDNGNLLYGMTPDHAGVTTGTNLEELGGTGGNLGFEGITDGIIMDPTTNKKQDAQFWNGKPADTKFVFTYDLGKNYDLSKISVYAVADYVDAGVHQGIETWTFYASRYRADLFKDESKVAGKTGYSDPEDITKTISMKQIRFVSFVFTIKDSLYGACRLTELEVYGVESAEQDSDLPVELPDEYRDLEAANDVIIRIVGLNDADDLSLLDVKATVEKISSGTELRAVMKKLDNRYYVNSLFHVSITDSNGDEVDLGGRDIRLMIPVTSQNYVAVVVDAFGADLLKAKYEDGCMIVPVINDGVYALATTSGQPGDLAPNDPAGGNGDEDIPTSPVTGMKGVALLICLMLLSSTVLIITKKTKKA